MRMTEALLQELCQVAVDAARSAGEIIQTHVSQDIAVYHKEGGDTLASQVVTEVDRMAEEAIVATIKPISEKLDLAILTEETPDDESRFEKDYFWSIDPMDGPCLVKRNRLCSIHWMVERQGSPCSESCMTPVRMSSGRQQKALEFCETERLGNQVSNRMFLPFLMTGVLRPIQNFLNPLVYWKRMLNQLDLKV